MKVLGLGGIAASLVVAGCGGGEDDEDDDEDDLTLQICTPYPTFEKCLIVRADRV